MCYGEIRFRYKCLFDYKNNQYTNISLTDPVYRDVAQDGTNLSNALIIASLPCVPYKDNLFYKFVAKIIPIDEQLATYIESINEDNLSILNITTNSNIKSPFVKFDLVVSGCNNGYNLSFDAVYSGTLGACFQAMVQDIPTFAFSTDVNNFDIVKKYGKIIIKDLFAKKLFPPRAV